MEKTELKCRNKDRFPDEIVGLFTETANYVLSHLKFCPWRTDEESNRNFNRGYRDIIESRKTHFLFPCLDTAVIAVSYLDGKKFPVFLKVLVEEENVQRFRDRKSRVLGIDSIIEVHIDSGVYGMNIGAGDITLLTPAETPLIHSGTNTYFTTRHNPGESLWTRNPILVLNAAKVGNIPPLCYLGELPGNLVRNPLNVRRAEIMTQNLVPGKPTISQLNQQYDRASLTQYNRDWTESNSDFFKGLRTFEYE